MKKPTSFRSLVLEALKLLANFIGCLFLIGLAVLLTFLSVLASVVWYLSTIWKKKEKARDILSKSANLFYLIALAIDHLGNVMCGGFFNWLLLKEESIFPFGVPGESMSEVLGWNHTLENLSQWGENLRHDLDTIDREHCEKAMMSALFDARYKIVRYKAISAKIHTIQQTKEFTEKYS